MHVQEEQRLRDAVVQLVSYPLPFHPEGSLGTCSFRGGREAGRDPIHSVEIDQAADEDQARRDQIAQGHRQVGERFQAVAHEFEGPGEHGG